MGCEHVFLQSVEGNGIGAVAVHPARKNFAVCEKGVSPNIYIYNYPSLELYKVNISLSLSPRSCLYCTLSSNFSTSSRVFR